jgi:site-specific DNA-cytosine methylase
LPKAHIQPQPATALAVLQPTIDDNVPATCCYFCRGRGGKADQECVFAGGADSRCNRCISDKKRICRQATAEEIRKFTARCDRCKIRGFKACDGGRPHCDTCIRNNTQAACWRPRKSQTQERASSAAVSSSLQQSSLVRRPKRTRRRVEVGNPLDDGIDDATLDDEPVHESDTDKEAPSELVDTGNDQIVVFDGMEMDDYAGGDAVIDYTRDNGNDGMIQDGASPLSSSDSVMGHALSTDATSIAEDDEAQIQREIQQHWGAPVPKASARSRRSLPRVSYVELIPDASSDHEPDNQHDDDDESDIYLSSASISESVADDNEFENEDYMEDGSIDEENDKNNYDEEEEQEVSIITDINSAKSKPKPRARKKPSEAPDGKGIDFKLPPINNIEDAFVDLAAKAIELGLDNVLEKLNGRQINVATMCSGTESPLLAFEMLSKALEQAGQPPLNVHQKFAAEIEVFKQAFIERNQSPEIIFRDVREFIPDDATTAITAYGAEASIPLGVDVLIAGFVCKDLSRLNSQPKGLGDDGESGDTWRAIYSYAKRFRPSIVLLENVKGLSKLWNEVVSLWDDIGYEAAWLIRDTKRYRIPQTRERMYMIAIERSHFGKDVKKAVSHWQDVMEKLQRQCSSPYEAWLKDNLHESSDHSALCSEVDWALCKLRYDHIRSEERLGILRPVTKWSENGTVRYVATTNILPDNSRVLSSNNVSGHLISQIELGTTPSLHGCTMPSMLPICKRHKRAMTHSTRWLFSMSARTWIDSRRPWAFFLA